MQPSHNENPGLSLPAPEAGSALAVPVSIETTPQQPEMAVAAPEQASAQPAVAAPPIAPITLPVSISGTVQQVQTDVSATTQASLPIMADDGDLIEKEWVQKAKQIVERTREDPHQQSKELTVFKSDYMQKRYNKIVKPSE